MPVHAAHLGAWKRELGRVRTPHRASTIPLAAAVEACDWKEQILAEATSKQKYRGEAGPERAACCSRKIQCSPAHRRGRDERANQLSRWLLMATKLCQRVRALAVRHRCRALPVSGPPSASATIPKVLVAGQQRMLRILGKGACCATLHQCSVAKRYTPGL